MSRTLLVTGASKGIGFETVRQFFYGDNDVSDLVLLARDSETFTTNVAKLEDDNPHGKRPPPYLLDLADRGRIVRLMAEVMSRHGSVDLLVNNAGYTDP